MKRTRHDARAGMILLLISALSLLAALLQAQAQPIFTLDAASFQQKGGLVYLEVYLMAQRSELKFASAPDGFQAAMEITLNLHSPDTLLSTTSWEVVDKVADLKEITTRQKLPDIAIFPQLAPGKYRIEARVKDLLRDSAQVRDLRLDLQAFSDSLLCLSDIEIVSRLEKTAEKGKFWKNGFLVVPNPERLYGPSLPMLYYYAEIYNLKSAPGTFAVDRLILDSERKEIKRLPQKTHQKVGVSAVEVDGISVASLESGTYFLQLLVEDQDARTTVSREIKFFVYRAEDFAERPEVRRGGLPLTPDEQLFSTLSDAQLDDAIEELKYLLDDEQWHSSTGLNAEGKRQFLIRFWKERDPDPSTPINEFRQIFSRRQAIADQKFSVLGKEGWKSDRGRVFILSGPPDDVEYHTHDLESRPYEIWHYDAIEGGVIFVFVDRNNFGDYRLVHSTKNGELNRSDWLNEVASVRK